MIPLQNNEKKTDIFRTPAFGEYVFDHVHNASDDLLLKAANTGNPRTMLFAAQAILYRKAVHKLPRFVNNLCVLSPRAYEQSSSEATALYKAGRYTGLRVLDCCGGLGVDDWALASRFAEVVSLDTDAELNELVRYNLHERMKMANVQRLDRAAEDYLAAESGPFDLVYADADRRAGGQRVIGLRGSQPDVTALLPRMLHCSHRVLIKASPMADITACLQQLQHVQEVEVLSVQNEVKELLFHIDRNYTGGPLFRATDIDAGGIAHSFAATERKVARPSGEQGNYFFEPALALIKAGLADAYAASLGGLVFPGKQAVYLLGDKPVESFMGRTFAVVSLQPYTAKNLVAYLRAAGIHKANVARRDFPETVEVIRRKLKLEDGGEDYFFFTRSVAGKLVCYHCRRA